MRTHAELTEARSLIERLLTVHTPRGSADVLRGQIQVLDWVMHRKMDAFAVRLLAAKAARPKASFL